MDHHGHRSYVDCSKIGYVEIHRGSCLVCYYREAEIFFYPGHFEKEVAVLCGRNHKAHHDGIGEESESKRKVKSFSAHVHDHNQHEKNRKNASDV